MIAFAYDANGNTTAITPPGRSAHAFTYSPVDLVATYVPPALGAASSATTYAYDMDRQRTRIARPDGARLDVVAYDAGGQPSRLTRARGDIRFEYDAASGALSKVTAPDGGILTYAYDGFLVTNVTLAGTVAGNIERSYDNSFRVSAVRVNGSPVSFTYDCRVSRFLAQLFHRYSVPYQLRSRALQVGKIPRSNLTLICERAHLVIPGMRSPSRALPCLQWGIAPQLCQSLILFIKRIYPEWRHRFRWPS